MTTILLKETITYHGLLVTIYLLQKIMTYHLLEIEKEYANTILELIIFIDFISNNKLDLKVISIQHGITLENLTILK